MQGAERVELDLATGSADVVDRLAAECVEGFLIDMQGLRQQQNEHLDLDGVAKQTLRDLGEALVAGGSNVFSERRDEGITAMLDRPRGEIEPERLLDQVGTADAGLFAAAVTVTQQLAVDADAGAELRHGV